MVWKRWFRFEPMTDSKHKQIETHLLSGKPLTGLQAIDLYGVYRLSSVINRLRKKHDIETTMIERNGESYGQYQIKETI